MGDDDPIADATWGLHSWWVEQWQELVPVLMTMKPDPEKSEDADEKHSDDVMKACSHLNNERGDDYQDQIGMPDEEHMRNWSHHHNTNTVDDPIFRAAMRGYNSVSFVFGLEVTWDNLQKRQSEEDDLRAMNELEELEELQNLQEEDDEEDKDDLKPKADLDSDDSNASIAEVEVGPSSSDGNDNDDENSPDTTGGMVIDSNTGPKVIEASPAGV